MRYRFESFLLDTDTGQLQRAGEGIALRRQTFRLLQCLVEAAPSLLDRDTLLDAVWGRSALSPNVVPQAISELRQVLGDSAQNPRFIETRHRLGYRFIATVSQEEGPGPQLAAAASAAGQTSTGPEGPLLARSSSHRTKGAVVLAMLVLALLVSGLALRDHASPQDSSPAPSVEAVALAMAGFSREPEVPEWVVPASRELLSRRFGAEPSLRLLRAEGLLEDQALIDSRWPFRLQDLLGASIALVGHWRSVPGSGALRLEFSLVDLGSGRVLLADALESPLDELDLLTDEAARRSLAALRIASTRAAASGGARPEASQRLAYWQALHDLSVGQDESALQRLRALDSALERPLWLESALVRALRASGQVEEAASRLRSRLGQDASLPLGDSLRLKAELARLEHQPEQAAAAWRALAELFPGDVELLLQLAETELDALQGASLRRTLARIEGEPRAINDPRLGLLRARLALLDGDAQHAGRLAGETLALAQARDLPAMVAAASGVMADALAGQGRLVEAAELLAGIDQSWSGRLSPLLMADLRLRRLAQLREMGRLSEAESVLQALRGGSLPGGLPARIDIEAALLHFLQDQPARAREALDSMTQYVSTSSDPDLRIAWFNARGVVALAQGEQDAAAEAFEQAFSLARTSGSARRHVGLQVNAGLLLARQRRFVEAEAHWEQALAVFERLGDRRGQAVTLGNLAASASSRGQVARSRELNERALLLLRSLQLPGPLARTAYNLGLIELREGAPSLAAERFAEAGDAWRKEGLADLLLQAVAARADALRLMDALDEAERVLSGAEDWLGSAGPAARARWLEAGAEAARERGAFETARSRIDEALDLRRSAGQLDWVELGELSLLRIGLRQGADASGVLLRAENLARRFAQRGEHRDAARAYLLMAEAALSSRQPLQAATQIERASLALADFNDLAVAFERDWLQAWAAPEAERQLRLRMLQDAAESAGHTLQARRAREALQDLESALDRRAADRFSSQAPTGRTPPQG